MAGLVVTIGGKLDPSFKAALAQAESASAASRARLNQQAKDLNRALLLAKDSRSPAAVYEVGQAIERTRIAIDSATRSHVLERTEIEKKISAYKKLQTAAFAAQGGRLGGNSGFLKFLSGESSAVSRAEARANAPMQGPDLDGAIRHANDIEQARRNIKARALRRERAEARANAATEISDSIAKQKAEQLAKASAIARGYGAASSLRGGHGGPASPAGIISEVAVIGHEVLQGRGTGRILGSISILGQRLGWLRKIIKTTADEHIDAAAASEKLAMASARETLLLEEKAVATAADATATEADKVATQQAAAASIKRTMALQAETAKLVEKAEIEKTTAKLMPTTIARFGLMGIAIAAALLPLILLIHYFSKLADQQKNLNDVMFGGFTQAQQQTEAFNNQAQAARNLARELDLVGKKQLSLSEISEKATQAIIAKAEAENSLADATKKRVDAQIEFDEKTGKISKSESARQRADADVQAIQDQQARKVKELADVKWQKQNDLTNAENTLAAKKDEFKSASEKSTAAGGIGSSKIKELADIKREEEALAKWKDALAERSQEKEFSKTRAVANGAIANVATAGLSGLTAKAFEAYSGETGGKLVGKVDGKSMPAATPEEVAEKLKKTQEARQRLESQMSRSEVATADAKRKMDDAEQSTLKLRQDVIAADRNLTSQKTTGQSVADKEVEARRIREKEETMPDAVKNLRVAKMAVEEAKNNLGRGDNAGENWALQKDLMEKRNNLAGMIGGGAGSASSSLNQMQKLGAFSAQGGNPLIAINQDMRTSLRQLVSLYGQQQRANAANQQGQVAH